MAITALDYPALEGRAVTEAHAKICHLNGHAVRTLDGVPTPLCPRCGEVRTTATTAPAVTIKPLTPLMTAMLVNVAEKGEAMAKGRDLITLRGLEARGLVQITTTGRDIHSDRNSRAQVLFYTTTDAGFAKAVELV